MRLFVAALLLLASGCDRVFGFDPEPVSADGGGDDGDAGGETVTVQWTHIYAGNAADGSPSAAVEPEANATIAVQLADEDPVPLTADAGGTFHFTRPPGATYRLVLAGADLPLPITLEHSAPQLELAVHAAGRPERRPVTLSTILSFTPSTPGSPDRYLASTGLWTLTPFPSGDAFDWRNATSLSGDRGLLDGSAGDRLYYLVRGTTTTTQGLGYTHIVAESSTGVSLVDGVSAPVALAPMPRSPETCVMLDEQVGTELTRLKTLMPAVTGSTAGWAIAAVTAPETGPAAALTVAAQLDGSPITDAAFRVDIHNPVPGAPLYATMTARGYRTVLAPAPIGLLVPVSIETWVPAMDCGATSPLAPTLGIPGTVSLDGVELSEDLQHTPLAQDRRIEVSWTLADAGIIDFAIVTIHELTAAGQTTDITPVRAYETLRRGVSVDPGVLKTGRTYVIEIDGFAGFPHAADGDFRTVAYPFGKVVQYSRPFVVMP